MLSERGRGGMEVRDRSGGADGTGFGGGAAGASDGISSGSMSSASGMGAVSAGGAGGAGGASTTLAASGGKATEVTQDVFVWLIHHPAKFVRRYADVGAVISDAITTYKQDVTAGNYPSDAESYHLPKDTAAALDDIVARKKKVVFSN